MKALVLSVALALAASARTPQEPGQESTAQVDQEAGAPGAPAKTPIAGLAGFRSGSRVVLGTEPEQVLRLEAYYVFPQRVRWSLLPEGAAATRRQLYYRFGDSYWSVLPGKADSQELEADPRGPSPLQTKIHMELRRALMLWPDGLDWQGEGQQRSARTRLEGGSGARPLLLSARLDPAGRPGELHASWDAPDESLDTGVALIDVRWRQQGERWWPHTFTLVGFGDTGWRETVETIETAVNALDTFFVPPDRRGELGARPATAPVLVTLPPTCQRRFPLEAGTDLESALGRARVLKQQEAQRLHLLDLSLAEGLALEIDASGAPCGVLLRLEASPRSLPEGWERLAERQAVSAPWSGRGPLTPRSLDRLRALLPAGARAEAGYLRIAPGAQGGEVRQIVLPFAQGR